MNDEALKKLLQRFPCKELPTGSIRTCPVRISYPYLFQKAKPMDANKEPVYMVTLLFPKQADVSVLDAGLAAAGEENFGKKWESICELPWRAGDERKFKDKPGYGPGVKWFRASSGNRPDVVDRFNERIEKADDVYAGCWALVTLRPYAVQHGEVKRVTFGLQNVMKLLDDDRLGGGKVSAAAEFEPITDLDDIEALMAGDAADEPPEADDDFARMMG